MKTRFCVILILIYFNNFGFAQPLSFSPRGMELKGFLGRGSAVDEAKAWQKIQNLGQTYFLKNPSWSGRKVTNGLSRWVSYDCNKLFIYKYSVG